MIKSRRDFLRSFSAGAAAGAAAGWRWGNISAADAVEPDRTRNGFILLNSNENAYGLSPRVASAISSATSMANRYAFRKNGEVTERIASLHRGETRTSAVRVWLVRNPARSCLRFPGRWPPTDTGFAYVRIA